ncbi:MAG: DmpA family aminopeptidase [Candidatus Hodarchaeales archaeon]|jgi:L-aminopeptidase/D-esterase-like protein
MTRARDLQIPFDGTPGRLNSITDVEGVRVGHSTIIKGEGELVVGDGPVRTGVTIVQPRSTSDMPVFAGWYSLNGNGEMTGTTWIEESGYLFGPIGITNTHSVGTVRDSIIEWFVSNKRLNKNLDWSLPVVAETYDGVLNDVNGFHVKKEHVFSVLDKMTNKTVLEGNVGGGTGMICHGFKGGIGTSSRRILIQDTEYTLGVLVQANYGNREDLNIARVPVGKLVPDLMPKIKGSGHNTMETGSIIVIVATDVPLLPHQLKRIARRVPIGIGRVGGYGGNSSGDIFLSFSTSNEIVSDAKSISDVRMLSNNLIDGLFLATVQATEEAIINALISAETMTGINNNIVYALPHEKILEIFEKTTKIY